MVVPELGITAFMATSLTTIMTFAGVYVMSRGV